RPRIGCETPAGRFESSWPSVSVERKRKQPCFFVPSAFDGGMFPYVTLAKDKSWQPGPYDGVELLVLHKNETTGGVTILRKFRAGLTVPAHVHPQANEYAYVLSGEWEESGAVYTTGAFFFAPKGVKHGPHHAKTEVISLTVFDGPLTAARSERAGRSLVERGKDLVQPTQPSRHVACDVQNQDAV